MIKGKAHNITLYFSFAGLTNNVDSRFDLQMLIIANQKIPFLHFLFIKGTLFNPWIKSGVIVFVPRDRPVTIRSLGVLNRPASLTVLKSP